MTASYHLPGPADVTLDPDDLCPDAGELAEQEEPEELDLDELEATLADAKDYLPQVTDLATGEVLAAVKPLIAELRMARERLIYWRGLPTHEEFAITDGLHPENASVVWPGSAEDAQRLADGPGRKPWIRHVSEHGWQQYDNPAEFAG